MPDNTTFPVTKTTRDRLAAQKQYPGEKWDILINRLLDDRVREHTETPKPAAPPCTTALTLANEPPKNTEAD